MTEDQYIAATNLAKVRIALEIVKDLVDAGPITEEAQAVVIRQLKLWRVQLEAGTDISPDEAP